jgi:hypothetical protein
MMLEEENQIDKFGDEYGENAFNTKNKAKGKKFEKKKNKKTEERKSPKKETRICFVWERWTT